MNDDLEELNRDYVRSVQDSDVGRYTDIWARRNGRWLCVAAHVTRG